MEKEEEQEEEQEDQEEEESYNDHHTFNINISTLLNACYHISFSNKLCIVIRPTFHHTMTKITQTKLWLVGNCIR